jgi:hypothetical protein
MKFLTVKLKWTITSKKNQAKPIPTVVVLGDGYGDGTSNKSIFKTYGIMYDIVSSPYFYFRSNYLYTGRIISSVSHTHNVILFTLKLTS